MGIRVLIADDHAVVRSGLGMLIDAQPDLEVVAMPQTGKRLLTRPWKSSRMWF